MQGWLFLFAEGLRARFAAGAQGTTVSAKRTLVISAWHGRLNYLTMILDANL
jgi:hypothetical protein